jgi:hypothetical protein
MELPELAAAAATVLAAGGALPQCVRLGRTRDHAGVSLTGATLGVATEAAWVLFLVHSHIWPAVTMPVLMVIANASLVFWIVRAGADNDSALVAAAGWVLVLVAVIVLGGWTALGFLLGFSYAVQIAPTIYAAYRSELPTGIAPARWVMVLCETALWTFYGFTRHEPSIFIFGIVAGSSAAAILIRWATTRHRLTMRAPNFRRANPHEPACRRSPTLIERGGDAVIARVLVTGDAADPSEDLGDVDRGLGGNDRVDVDPVLGPVEHGLAHDEMFHREYGDLAIGERDHAARRARSVVEGVVREEQIDRCRLPHHAGLAVGADLIGDGGIVGRGAERDERSGDRRELVRRDEDIEVDVDGGARLRVVRERERAAERMRDRRERLVECNDAFGERERSHDETSRGARRTRLRGRCGIASASESTSSKRRACSAKSAACGTSGSARVSSRSRPPPAATSFCNVPTVGSRRSCS